MAPATPELVFDHAQSARLTVTDRASQCIRSVASGHPIQIQQPSYHVLNLALSSAP